MEWSLLSASLASQGSKRVAEADFESRGSWPAPEDRRSEMSTHILSEEVVLQSPARVQPYTALGLLVSKEEAVLGSRAQALDLSQLLAESLAGLHHCGLKMKIFL